MLYFLATSVPELSLQVVSMESCQKWTVTILWEDRVWASMSDVDAFEKYGCIVQGRPCPVAGKKGCWYLLGETSKLPENYRSDTACGLKARLLLKKVGGLDRYSSGNGKNGSDGDVFCYAVPALLRRERGCGRHGALHGFHKPGKEWPVMTERYRMVE